MITDKSYIMSVIDYQDYKIKISNPKSECYILTVVGRAPNNINVNYKALFENMVSICFQTNPDNTGVFHIIMNYKGIRHEFQFLLKNIDKNEHKDLYEFFIPYLRLEYLSEDPDSPRRASP